jgi:hypothetical protein
MGDQNQCNPWVARRVKKEEQGPARAVGADTSVNRPAVSLVSKEFHTFKVVFPGKSGQL